MLIENIGALDRAFTTEFSVREGYRSNRNQKVQFDILFVYTSLLWEKRHAKESSLEM